MKVIPSVILTVSLFDDRLLTYNFSVEFRNVYFWVDSNADVDHKDKNQRTALMNSAAKNRVDVVQALLSAKCSVDLEDEFNETALNFASRKINVELIRLLSNVNRLNFSKHN